jgi:hypothetical protein
MTPGRTWPTIIGLMVTAVVVAWFAYNGGTIPIEFTEQEAQERLDAALAKRAEGDPKILKIDSAIIHFIDNKLEIDGSVTGEWKNRVVHADIHGIGTPEYRGGSIYFLPSETVTFSNLTIEKRKEGDGGPVFFSRTMDALKKRTSQFIEEHDLTDLTEAFKADLKDWLVASAEKVVTEVLSRHSIYTVKNTPKGIVIKAVLEKVTIAGNKVIATLSFAQLGYTIIVALLLAILGIGLIAFLLFVEI